MVVEMALCFFTCIVVPIVWDWRKPPDKTGQGQQVRGWGELAPLDKAGQGGRPPPDNTRQGRRAPPDKTGQGQRAPSNKAGQGDQVPSRSKGKTFIEAEDSNSVFY